MIKVAVAGCNGRMGEAVVNAVQGSEDMKLVCGIDPEANGSQTAFPIYTNIGEAIENEAVDVLVDFTRPDVVAQNVKAALLAGVNCVVGTTGLTTDELEALAADAIDGACLFYAPNFTTGAVLMMQFAKAAAPFFPQVEIIESHHCNKLDAPSGTAKQTAHMIAEAREGRPSDAPGSECETAGCEGARGALVEGIPVHSVRTSGSVADQEVIFGSYGQSLSISHRSWDRQSYMPGVLLGIRSVADHSGLIIGLESFM